MNVSPFVSSELVLAELVEFSTSQECDLENPLHLCEHERSSSPLIEFEPLPTSCIMLFPTMVENQHCSYKMHLLRWRIRGPWKSIRHQLWSPKEGISSTSMVAILLIYLRNHACIMSLQSQRRSVHRAHIRTTTALCSSPVKNFKRTVVDACIYHKHCRFHVCPIALTL
jgi:hypothetical protein